ncbi:MAG: ABC transporter permease [Eubacteriales bacterium]|nr:ABC transporter permease [Eubacteriales bacterium]
MYSGILVQASTTGMLALGMMFVLICGNIDLAVGAQSALYGVLCVFLTKSLYLPPPAAIMLTLLTAATVGAVIGYVIAAKKLNAMIATIAVGVAVSGLASILANGTPVFDIPALLEQIAKLKVFNIPFPAVLFLMMAALTAWILHGTYWGRFFFARGWDVETAAKAGVPVHKTCSLAFALSGMYTAVASILYVGRVGVASLSAGDSWVLDVLTIAALGGVGFSGGRGRVLPVVCSAVFLSLLTAAFLVLRIAPYYQNVIKGAILFFAISTKITKS